MVFCPPSQLWLVSALMPQKLSPYEQAQGKSVRYNRSTSLKFSWTPKISTSWLDHVLDPCNQDVFAGCFADIALFNHPVVVSNSFL